MTIEHEKEEGNGDGERTSKWRQQKHRPVMKKVMTGRCKRVTGHGESYVAEQN